MKPSYTGLRLIINKMSKYNSLTFIFTLFFFDIHNKKTSDKLIIYLHADYKNALENTAKNNTMNLILI